MSLRVTSTAGVPIQLLRKFRGALLGELDIDVDESQIFLRSSEPPTWVQFLADAPWWLQAFGAYAGLYVAELVKEAAKTTWAERAAIWRNTRSVSEKLGRFARALAELRGHLPERSRLVIGLPVPDDYFGVRFELIGRQEDVLAAEVAVFSSFVPALESLIEIEKLNQGRVVGAINLLVADDLSVRVAWMERETLTIQERVLRHPK